MPNRNKNAEETVSCAAEETCGCSCCQHEDADRQIDTGVWYKSSEFYEIFIGAVFFIAAQIISFYIAAYQLPLLIISYLILGKDILLSAGRNILNGRVFDENFLMSIATIGAFAIEEYPEAVGVMLFFRVGEFFEERAANKSRKQIIDAVDMRPETVMLVDENNEVTTAAADQAAVGDIIMVRPGDRIPLDGTVIEGVSQIDASPLTGESVPVMAAEGGTVLSGCINKTGVLKIRVEKVLAESMVSKILAAVQSAAANKPRIQRFISRFARVYTPIVVVIAVLIAVIPSLITGQWHDYIYIALTFLVISCPCALVLSVPLAFFSGIGTASRQGILFKDGAAIEALTQIKAAALDKTGTITQGIFAVQEIKAGNNFTEDEILQFCASAENASSHPLAVSIVRQAKEKMLDIKPAADIEEVSGKGVKAYIDNKKIVCGNAAFMQDHNIQIGAAAEKTAVYLAVDNQYAGCIALGDKIKEDAVGAIAKLKQQGISVAMLTGDSAEGAAPAAREAGIDIIHARLLPQEKLDILQKIRSEKGKVLFVGDGINDAPVLANADVGAAMGSGADAAIEAADVVFMTSRVDAIPYALKLAKTTRSIAVQNVVFALAVKLIIMICGLLGYASLWSAVFADTGVAIICVLNAVRILYSDRFA
ncbi:heavy metal translocating P-type ATPase [Pectinatus haikarae]|uniref:Cd(2+)-exporting ATPase n=1 Tax=Pectinatus haikarae TaxID=349096 RepID=A0ABT9Y840_9FIRM|nr:heavy metal translocating P-type ATPase [Pectinatus haikarae]MDQ0204003.1 Cd2+/Zn2+-exporting ATPase [Pectinatus haikarae]